jgi:hypothetical protein
VPRAPGPVEHRGWQHRSNCGGGRCRRIIPCSISELDVLFVRATVLLASANSDVSQGAPLQANENHRRTGTAPALAYQGAFLAGPPDSAGRPDVEATSFAVSGTAPADLAEQRGPGSLTQKIGLCEQDFGFVCR